jgi:GDP-4-dehydro-6-deoxy-D-mannose reductase
MATYKRILLTGGTGFVGKHLLPSLAAACGGAELVSVSRTPEVDLSPGWRHVFFDVGDELAVDALIEEVRPDLVVHLAAQASIGEAARAADRTWHANFLPTYRIAVALARHAPEATVFFSSSATIYGASFLDGPVNEMSAAWPLDAYSRSKLASEMALADILSSRARLIVARPVNHSGALQASRNFVLPSFAAQIVAIENGRAPPIIVVGDLSKSRDFLDVRDVVSAYTQLIVKADALPRGINCFNVASGSTYTVKSLLDILRSNARCSFEISVDKDLFRGASVDVPVMCCEATRLKNAIGWQPHYSINDMLVSLLDYWRSISC